MATIKRLPSALSEGVVGSYQRRDVLRILRVTPRQLAGWERAGLLAARQQYSFADLGQVRALRDLRAGRFSTRSIGKHLSAMQRLTGVSNVLLESTALGSRSGMVFRHDGGLVNPVTQQLSLDFAAPSREPLRLLGVAETAIPTFTLQEMFIRAVRLEESDATRLQAAELYEEILADLPSHAASAINLGTIRYGQRRFAEAERLYRSATVADPEYALAFFDLGNVLDEMLRVSDAVTAYQRAIDLVPQYADAHYNLALAYERQGERRRALRHWLIYVRLDPEGPWATHAKGQARKILSTERLTIVSRRGRLVAS